MRKIFALVLLAPLLAGCNWQTIKTAVVGVRNPVTIEQMYRVEQTAIVVTSALNAYRNLCVQKLIDQKCRDVIIQAQSFTKPAAQYLVTLRTYFRNNDTINAINAYNVLTQLLADARAVAVANGVAIQ